MIVGVEPCFDFRFVVEYFASDFVVEKNVVVAVVPDGSEVKRKAFGEFFAINAGLPIECGSCVFDDSVNHLD